MTLTRLHIASFVGLTIIAWLIALWVQGNPILSLAFLKPFGIVVSVITTIALVFNNFAWSWPMFKNWYVKRPDVRGTWKVVLKSNWLDPETGQGVAPITAYMTVKQTLTSLHMRLMTPESTSKLIAHNMTQEEDGLYRITGVYRNEPKIDLRGVRSEIHYGALSLEIHGDPPVALEGNYWTDRNTNGYMRLIEKKETMFHDYESANKSTLWEAL